MEKSSQKRGPSFCNLSEISGFLVTNSPFPTFLIDIDSQAILDCNEAAIKFFEYSKNDLASLFLPNLKQDPAKTADLENNIDNQIQPESSTIIRRYYTHSSKAFDAIEKWQLADSTNPNIYILQLHTLTPDNTSSKADQDRINFLMEDSHDIVWAMNLQLQFTFATPSVEDLVGYTQNEWIGSHLYNHCSRSEFIKMARITSSNIKNYKKFKHVRFESVFKHKDGTEIPVEIIGKLIFNKLGLPIGYHGTTRDITERQKARADLAREKAQLLSLIDHLPERIYFKDRDSRFLIANKAVAEHIGVDSVSKLIGKTDLDFYPIDHAKQYRIDEQNIMESQHAIINYEERVQNPDGKLGWTLASKIPIKDENGEVIALVGISRDISDNKKILNELKIAKELAEQSNMLKVNFIANVSHEIRTPLNAILGFSNLMKDEFEENGRIESGDYFDIITNAGDRLMRTIEMILNLSRIESGEINIHPVNIDLIPLVRQLEKEYELRAKQKNIDLIFNINTQRKTIHSDEYAFSHSLSNLIDNAIKYTKQGSIKVTIDDDANRNLICCIEDSGIGISKEYINKLFEPYSQEETGFARKYEGIGLGLSLTKRLVEMASGSICVQSQKNTGSTFTLCFPDLASPKD